MTREDVIELLKKDKRERGNSFIGDALDIAIKTLNNPCEDAVSRKEVINLILDKIKADIAMYEADCRLSCDEEPCKQCTDNVFGSIYRIIDKYKAGSEQ